MDKVLKIVSLSTIYLKRAHLYFSADSICYLKAGFHMIATIAMIAVVVVIAQKNSSAIVAIYGFHMIATIAEKVNEGRGDLRLTHSSRHSSNSTWRL